MHINRIFHRHGLPAAENPPKARGAPGQPGRHILKRGIRHARKLKRGNFTDYRPGLYPVELHATKGWRYVPAWS